MPLDYSRAFVDGRSVETEYGTATFKIHRIGELIVPTGFIVACDPFVFFDTQSFTTQIPVGRYPVLLSVASFNDNDERIAYAMLKISERAAAKWELALLPGQDITTLEEDEVFGYGVDAGTGCFMDAEAAKRLMEKDETYSDLMIAEMEKNFVPTWDWANLKIDEFTDLNVITFKSGWGDGVYASYFGFDENDEITSLVTDFALIEDRDIPLKT